MASTDQANQVIISAAITGGMTVPTQSAAIPVTPEEIIESAVGAYEAGAAIVHIHVRDPDTGRPSSDLALFREVLDGIKQRCPVIVQPTTGGGQGMTIEERAAVLTEFEPEMATFNTGSINFGLFPIGERDRDWEEWELEYLEDTRGYVFRNTFADMERICEMMRAGSIKPELEAYDVGHLYNIAHLLGRGLLDKPVHIQFVLGVLGANQPELEQAMHMLRTARSLFGTDFTWSAAGIGYPAEYNLAALGIMLGGQIRVGLEDNLRLSAGKRAESNAELVEKAVALAALFDRAPATPDQAREFFGLRGRVEAGS
ncbi:MAG TPA: 3-keto-5-aminohexanoate cleavage protein [Solirubrobacteraceae bacterium]